ncbi:MAG TPA: hypothetical protein VEA78_04265, partial [Acidimicrobiales bacterium]|nr:hypothetical protein [Acidimicrobiales bacterium]
LMFGHMMNKRRQLDSGSQMGSQSQIAALRSIKEMAYNPMAMGSFAKKGGNKDINKASSQSRKAQSNMYLAQVRNTESQLQQVRGDTTLTPEQRTEKAKHLREVSSEKIEESREELDKRNAAFTKARSQITKAISKIVQALFVVAVTAATAGQGTVAVIVSMILASIAREAGKSITKWAMEGDAYEHKDLAKAIVIGAVKGALRAATMELLLVIDAASTVVDFTPEGMAGFAEQSNYGELVKHAAIEASLRSAVTDIPMNTVKYMLTVDRPFRDFGRNLDVFVATNAVSVIGRQAASIVGSIASQGGKDVEKLFGPSGGGTSPSGGVLSDAQQTFEQQGKAQVGALVGRLAIVGKKVKTVLAKIAKKVWGTYPERWRQLSNDSLAAIGIQAEEEMDASSLPSAAEVDRLVALIDQIADGTLRPEDLSAKDKKGIGRMIVYARQQGVDLP